MEKLKVKGHFVNFIPTRASHNRKALQFKNKLINELIKLGTKRDDVEVEFNGFCGREDKACVTWYFDGHKLYYEVAYKNHLLITYLLFQK